MEGAQKEKGEVPIEEIIARYKEVRKSRRKYAIKQFFKIKRGALGLAILLVLTFLSLASPIIAPNPDNMVHSSLSRPYWMRYFDPNSFDDYRPYDLRFQSSSDLDTLKQKIAIAGEEYMSLKLTSIDLVDEGFFEKGSASFEIVDLKNKTTSSGIFTYDIYIYLLHKWDKHKIPYDVLADFARKFELEVDNIFDRSYTIPGGGTEIDYLNLSSIPRTFRFKAKLFYDSSGNVEIAIKNLDQDYNVYEDTLSGKGYAYLYLTAGVDFEITLKNTDNQNVDISIQIQPYLGDVYKGDIYTYVNLWNEKENRPYTYEEMQKLLKESGVPDVFLTEDGLKTSVYDPTAPIGNKLSWKDMEGRESQDQIITRLLVRDIYRPVLFKTGNTIVMTIKISISIQVGALEYLWKDYLPDPIKIRVYLDDIVWEIRDEYYGLMGTDKYGRDIFAMIVDGIKISLLVGFLATFANLLIGVSLGLISGYVGGKVDELIMRVVDFMMSIPILPLLLVISFIFFAMNMDPLIAIILVLSLLGWAGMARTIRSQVLALKSNVYVEAAKASGARSLYIMRKHILPGVMPLVMIYLMQGVVANILAEAGLSFLGVLRPTWHSLGKMIQEASGVSASGGGGGAGVLEGWHWIFFPGFILMLIGFSFYAIADAYDEIVNPKRRRRF